jgi:sugar phosphate isomerase/epimerase
VSSEPTRPTLAACEWIFGDRPLADTIAAVAAAGYDALVVVAEPGRRDLDELEKLLAEAGLGVAGATCDTGGRPERDLAHIDRALRQEAVAYYKRCVDQIERLGAHTLCVVPGAEGRLSPVSSYAEEWRVAVEATREVAVYAGERGVSLAIEPLNRYEAFLLNRVEQACAFVAEVGVDGVGLIADLFHMNIEERDSLAAIDLAGDRLLELHVADSNREGLGSGHLPAFDLLDRTRASGFRGTLVVECVAADPARLDGFLDQCARVVREVFPPGGLT